MSKSIILWTLGSVFIALVGCSEQPASQSEAPEVKQQASQTAQVQPAPAQTTEQPATAALSDPHRQAAGARTADPHAGMQMPGNLPARFEGRVVQTIQAKPYSYVEVDTDRGRAWLAAGEVRVAPGDTVAWADQAVMRNFKSKALNRTFDEVLFVTGLQPAAAGAGGAASSGKVLSAASSAGYTYIEVETPQGGRWLAAPIAPVKIGDEISWSGGSTMRNFTSKSLNKTFDEIDFVGAVNVQR